MSAFHAYDVRGVYNVDFDRDTVYKIGLFLGDLLYVDKVLVGRDVRVSSDEIHDALIEGITDSGLDVYDIGLATTPMVYWATAKLNFGASVQITASHNPKEYNGLKISKKNAMPVGFDDGLATIEKWILNDKKLETDEVKGLRYNVDIRRDYIEFLKQYLGNYDNLNIGVDLSNGMAALLIKDILGERPTYINDTLDGTFPGHEPNPLDPKNIRDLQSLVKKSGCDVGVIFDGDADRVMFVDEKGSFISPDLMIAVLGHYFFEKKGEHGLVLQDIRSSKAVGEYLSKMGAEVRTWRVGRAFAAPKLKEIDGLYGGELAGHYYFRDFFYSDSGIMAALLILDVISDMKKRGVSLSKLISGISKYVNSGEVNLKIDNKKEAMEYIKNYFVSLEKPIAIYDFDGYRVEFEEWWFNIRPSNTEPYLRFICEARTKKMLDEKLEKALSLLMKVTKYGLKLTESKE